MPNTIQPREYSKGGGTEGISYNFVNLNQWNDERKVNVNRSNGNRWNASNWFGGRRNPLLSLL